MNNSGLSFSGENTPATKSPKHEKALKKENP
jgi:hypothetical protein